MFVVDEGIWPQFTAPTLFAAAAACPSSLITPSKQQARALSSLEGSGREFSLAGGGRCAAMPGSDSVLRSTGSLALPNGTDVAPGGIDNVDAVANNDPAIEAAAGIEAPPGAAAGTVPTPPLPYGPRDWRARIGWVRQSPYFRRSVQCGLGTVVILVVLSPAAVARALTVSTSTSSSAGPPAFCLLNFYLLLLVSSASGQSPLQVGAQQIFGNLFGGALAIAGAHSMLDWPNLHAVNCLGAELGTAPALRLRAKLYTPLCPTSRVRANPLLPCSCSNVHNIRLQRRFI